MLSRGLHLSDLFEEELSELDEQERGYLTRIAAVLPSTYQALARRFDDDPFLRPILEKLTHRKLLRFSAGSYDTYNDVFKDFLLYERMPEQGQSELLRLGLVSVMRAFRSLKGLNHIDPQEVSKSWDKSITGTYNLLREMRLAGLVIKSPTGWEVPEVVRQYEHQGRLGEFVRQSLLKNRLVHSILVELEKSGPLTRSQIASWLQTRFPFISAGERVWYQYATTLSDWLARLNLAELSGERLGPWRGSADVARDLGNLAQSGRGFRPKKAHFLPGASWSTILSAWNLIESGKGHGQDHRRGFIAARHDLLKIGAITEEAGKMFRLKRTFAQMRGDVDLLLKGEPYTEFWRRINSGQSLPDAAKGLFQIESLAPGTKAWLLRRLANWGRHFGHVAMSARISHQEAGDEHQFDLEIEGLPG
jgi:hypothetical protein